MKKKTRNLIIMLLLVLVVGGAAAVLLLLPGSGTDDADEVISSEVSESIKKIVSIADTDVERIEVNSEEMSEGKEFIIIPGETTEEGVTYELTALEGLPMNTASITNLANGLITVDASKSIGAQEDMAAYGLTEDTAVQVKISHLGEETVYLIGNQSPDNGGRYVKLSDSDEIYIASIPAGIHSTVNSFVELTPYTVEDVTVSDSEGNTTTTNTFGEIKISGSNYEKPIEIRYDESASMGYSLVSPVKAEASSSKIETLLSSLKSFTASEAAEINYTDEDLKKYGLDIPSANLEFTMNGEKHTIRLGSRDESGMWYATVDDVRIIYLADSSSVSVWATANPMEMRATYIVLPNIKNVEKMVIAEGDTKLEFDITRTENEASSTETETVYDLGIKLGNGEISYEDTYQPFYKKIIELAVLSIDEVEYDKSRAAFSAEYTYFAEEGTGAAGTESDRIDFYPVEGKDRYAVELNGAYNGIIKKASLDEIIALVEPLSKNEKIA